MKRNGFTLVEMLVALGIFALLAAAGVGVLRSSVDVQGAVDSRLTDLSAVARLNAMLSNDLAQALDRPTRAPGAVRPAFFGDSSGMAFVSGGRTNIDGAPRSELQRIEWRSTSSTLQRIGFTAVDGGDESIASPIARNIRSAAFRYRMIDGTWNSSFTSTPQQPLPTAVEMTLIPAAGPPVAMVFALPAGAIPPQPTQAPTGGPMPDQLPPSERGA
jgi:general secretion pathway protein J